MYNWIDAKEYSFECFFLFDRWIIEAILDEKAIRYLGNYTEAAYLSDLSIAMKRHPAVRRYCERKAPSCRKFLNRLQTIEQSDWNEQAMREAEERILQAQETFVVYAYPEAMERVNYIRNWHSEHLYRLVDLDDKLVLDVGGGTGRLAFAAAAKAKRVYASEPVDCLRDYMRDKIRARNITNMKVVDGIVTDLPFENDTFDAVLSGHVVGDRYDEEIAEMSRVCKPGGWLVICNGDDEFKRKGPMEELTRRGFESFCHTSVEGGIIYDYRKQICG